MASVRVGISGWRYAPWRGTFYPADLPQRSELSFAAARLAVIEINGSFYALQRPASYASWYAQTPEHFRFTVKAPRYITHTLRLQNVAAPLANFLASGLFNLKEKLGPILWQFPPSFKFDAARMQAFLKLLPADTKAAARIARGHESWLKGSREQLKVDAQRPLRHAIEIRHASFLDPAFVELLRTYNVALVIAETARRWPMAQDITADFAYLRLHGDKELYRSGYSDRSLDKWARRIKAWQRGGEPRDADKICAQKPPRMPRDVYCFFDNTDVKLRAPFDAQTLVRKLGKIAQRPQRSRA
jgi:uncharacterized protein YecE (DUF72 family)